MKHNKKRNTKFLYEILIQELTYSALGKENNKKKVFPILKEFFSRRSPLGEELIVYNHVFDLYGTDEKTVKKGLDIASERYSSLDQSKIFNSQTKLISKINTILSPELFKKFLPKYKTYATLSQFFNKETPIKSKIVLENEFISSFCTPKKKEIEPIDNIVFKKFVEKFNEKYLKDLNEQQQKLLSKYVFSINEDYDFKIYLNDELRRLLEEVKKSVSIKEVCEDEQMKEKVQKTIKFLEEDCKDFENIDLEKVLKIQEYVEECQKS